MPFDDDKPFSTGGPDASFPESLLGPMRSNQYSDDEALSRKAIDIHPIVPKKNASKQTVLSDAELAEIVALPVEKPTKSVKQQEKARLRQAVYLQKRRNEKRRKVLFSRLRVFLKLVCSAILIVGLYWGLNQPFWRFSPAAFTLHQNNGLIQSQHIARFLQPFRQQPLYTLNPLKLAAEIQHQYPLIDQIEIRRRIMPQGLDIFITEKPSWGVIYTTPPIKVAPTASSEGTKDVKAKNDNPILLTEALPPHPVALLHPDNSLTDLSPFHTTPADFARMGQPVAIISPSGHIPSTQLGHLHALTQLLNSQPDRMRLQYLDISNPNDMLAQFDGFTVRFGRLDSTVMDRVNRLFSIISAIRAHQTEIQFVDLRWNHQVLFKKKATAGTTKLEKTEG